MCAHSHVLTSVPCYSMTFVCALCCARLWKRSGDLLCPYLRAPAVAFFPRSAWQAARTRMRGWLSERFVLRSVAGDELERAAQERCQRCVEAERREDVLRLRHTFLSHDQLHTHVPCPSYVGVPMPRPAAHARTT